jgi:hypothetical protein
MIKHAADESVKKYKARGFSQTKGVVYDKTLDPVNLIHFFCIITHELEVISNRQVLDEFGFHQKRF